MIDDDNFLWSGESVFCQCGHHVECHKTGMGVTFYPDPDSFYAFCHYKDNDGKLQDCSCKEFIPYQKKGDGKK